MELLLLLLFFCNNQILRKWNLFDSFYMLLNAINIFYLIQEKDTDEVLLS